MVILGRSPILTPGLRFLPLFLDWPFSSHSPFYQKNLLYPHLKNPSTLYWFFLPDSKFSPLLKGFLPIVHFSREISPSINKISVNLCVIFPNICHFHLSCQVLSVFANSPFDRGHRTAPPFHIPRTFCDLSPILSFSRCLSDFCPFPQIVI